MHCCDLFVVEIVYNTNLFAPLVIKAFLLLWNNAGQYRKTYSESLILAVVISIPQDKLAVDRGTEIPG